MLVMIDSVCILIMQPKKVPIMKVITPSSAQESNPEGEGQKVITEEPEVIVYVPSCKRF